MPEYRMEACNKMPKKEIIHAVIEGIICRGAEISEQQQWDSDTAGEERCPTERKGYSQKEQLPQMTLIHTHTHSKASICGHTLLTSLSISKPTEPGVQLQRYNLMLKHCLSHWTKLRLKQNYC